MKSFREMLEKFKEANILEPGAGRCDSCGKIVKFDYIPRITTKNKLGRALTRVCPNCGAKVKGR